MSSEGEEQSEVFVTGEDHSHHWDEDEDEDEEDQDEAAASLIARKHYVSTAAMCLCTFTHSWLLVSVFPYSGFMVIKLVRGTDEENAGSYAGLLAAAFMIGRALTSYSWGRIADTYGRRIVFFVSLILSAIFSFLFGLSTSFGLAFFWRFLLGASNGVAGISKAVVSETAQGNETLETRGMSLSMGMWAWGFLLSPAISGFLSDPIRQYPSLNIWGNEHTPIYLFLESYPFFLPNLVSVLLCMIDLVAVLSWVPETLPAEDLRTAAKMPQDFYNWLTSFLAGSNNSNNNERDNNNLETLLNETMINGEHLTHSESVSLLSTSAIELQSSPTWCNNNDETCNDTNNNDNSQEPPPGKATLAYLWSKKDTRKHLIVFWIFSFVAIAIDEAFPLFCISKEGGLGLSEGAIGKLLSATGFIFAASQYHVYAWIVDRYGLRRSIQLGALLSAPLVTFVPISLLLNNTNNINNMNDDGGESSTSSSSRSSLTWSSFLYLSLLLSFIRIFGLVFFSSITIATNRTVIPSHRGTMNGLSMLGGSIAKGLGPIFAGLLVSFGISSGVFAPKVGSAVVFVVIGVCSAIAAGIAFYLLLDDNNTSEENIDHDHGYGTENTSNSNNNVNQVLPIEGNKVGQDANKHNIT